MTITFYRKDSSGELCFYTIHDRQQNLFTSCTFTALWGRGLSSGREKSYTFESSTSMDEKLRELFKQRIREGYKVLYSFARKKRFKRMFNGIGEEKIS